MIFFRKPRIKCIATCGGGATNELLKQIAQHLALARG